MLKFKIDENMPIEAASLLVQAGHDALTVFDQNLSGKADPIIADICRDEGRAIVTLNLDFADIRQYPPADYAGLLVLRLARLDKNTVLQAVGRLVPVLEQEQLVGKLWIVEEARVRIRG